MLRYFYPGKEKKKDTQQNFRAGGHDSTEFIPRLQRRFRRSAAPGSPSPQWRVHLRLRGRRRRRRQSSVVHWLLSYPESECHRTLLPEAPVLRRYRRRGRPPAQVSQPGKGRRTGLELGKGAPSSSAARRETRCPGKTEKEAKRFFFFFFFLIHTQNASPPPTPPPTRS